MGMYKQAYNMHKRALAINIPTEVIGGVSGGLLGSLVGALIAGEGRRLKGALIGGAAGVVPGAYIGHQARSNATLKGKLDMANNRIIRANEDLRNDHYNYMELSDAYNDVDSIIKAMPKLTNEDKDYLKAFLYKRPDIFDSLMKREDLLSYVPRYKPIGSSYMSLPNQYSTVDPDPRVRYE